MFTRKKPFWQRKWFYFVIVGVFAFGYWANGDLERLADSSAGELQKDQAVMEVTPTDEENDPDPFVDGGERILPDEVIRAHAETKNAAADQAPEDPVEEFFTEEEDPQTKLQYYLIKEVNGEIQVYCVDRAGKETLFWNTEIPFSLLSETDQKLFTNGFRVESEAGLEELLQDFSS